MVGYVLMRSAAGVRFHDDVRGNIEERPILLVDPTDHRDDSRGRFWGARHCR